MEQYSNRFSQAMHQMTQECEPCRQSVDNVVAMVRAYIVVLGRDERAVFQVKQQLFSGEFDFSAIGETDASIWDNATRLNAVPNSLVDDCIQVITDYESIMLR